MSMDKGTFEALVPSRFITFTFPNPSHSTTTTATHHHLHTQLLRVAVLDSPSQPTTPNPPRIAAMIVPTHRETDWIFSTDTGHLQLILNSPEISRLILIGNLPIDSHPTIYTCPISIDPTLQSKLAESLTPLLLALSPKSAFKYGLPEIPFLGYEDDVIGSVIVERCVGDCVGEMLIEDVELEGKREFRRRLRFKRMPNLIQTQIRIIPNTSLDSVNLGDVEFGLDMASLVHPYLTPMVASLSLIGSYLEERIRGGFRPKALCLGVGGGALLTFLNNQLGFEVIGLEADEIVLNIAKKHFGLQDSKYVRFCVGDGIEFVEKLAGQYRKPNCDCVDNGCCLDNVDCLDAKFDVIMVDLDSSDAGMGIMAPPLEFVGKSVLLASRLVLSEHGILVINVIPPSRSFYETLIHKFQEFFKELYEIDVGNGENFVLIATALPIGTASIDYENPFLSKLKLVISGAYLDSMRKI
ncbi:hypothetical protein ACSBR2_007300 [Camellia fascicularis]